MGPAAGLIVTTVPRGRHTTMQQLWSPWRLAYVLGEKEAGCVFCDAPREPEASLVIWSGARSFVILNKYPYNNGHVMVVPVRHVPNLSSLDVAELHELASGIQLAERVLMRAYAPHGINIGVNIGEPAGAGILHHVHVHLVPRWNGDTNFMTVVGDTRVLPEDLASAAARLRPLFSELAA